MSSRSALLAAMVCALATAPAPASADSLYSLERTQARLATFTITGCGATDTVTLTMPSGASQVEPDRPNVGDRIHGDASGETFARITATDVRSEAGRRVVDFTAEGSDAACRPANANCETGLDDGCQDIGRSERVRIAARYTKKVRVYVRGTGRGGNRAYKPRVLPFGARSAVIGLRWRSWGRGETVGYGRVEFNNCIPNCAQARPSYFPVRVVVSRIRACGSVAQYRTFAFRYTTSRRPPGLPGSYRESFPC
jgi:hypothetical protein